MAGTPARPTLQLIGKPLVANADDLDQAATVTPIDVLLARAFWYRYASVRFFELLDAVRLG